MAYNIIAKTKKYALVTQDDMYLVENIEGLHAEEVPHLYITGNQFDRFKDYLLGHKVEPQAKVRSQMKSDGTKGFDRECDDMFNFVCDIARPDESEFGGTKDMFTATDMRYEGTSSW